MRKFYEPTQNCQNSLQFFTIVRDLERRDSLLEGIYISLIGNRNKISYLMKLFVEVYDYLEDDERMKNEYV